MERRRKKKLNLIAEEWAAEILRQAERGSLVLADENKLLSTEDKSFIVDRVHQLGNFISQEDAQYRNLDDIITKHLKE